MNRLLDWGQVGSPGGETHIRAVGPRQLLRPTHRLRQRTLPVLARRPAQYRRVFRPTHQTAMTRELEDAGKTGAGLMTIDDLEEAFEHIQSQGGAGPTIPHR